LLIHALILDIFSGTLTLRAQTWNLIDTELLISILKEIENIFSVCLLIQSFFAFIKHIGCS